MYKVIMAANGFEEEFMVWLEDNGFVYKEVLGKYKGVSERSFMISFSTAVKAFELFRQAKEYKQESILFISGAKASLVYVNSIETADLGIFYEVEEKYAYTFDPKSKRYYVAA
jgi:hypothetical protein